MKQASPADKDFKRQGNALHIVSWSPLKITRRSLILCFKRTIMLGLVTEAPEWSCFGTHSEKAGGADHLAVLVGGNPAGALAFLAALVTSSSWSRPLQTGRWRWHGSHQTPTPYALPVKLTGSRAEVEKKWLVTPVKTSCRTQKAGHESKRVRKCE